MDKIEKIRQEIKRRYDYENKMYHKKKPDGRPNDGWAESLAIMGVLEELLTFLDTLSEEPDKSLEEEIQRYLREECSGDDEPTVSEIARHFAEWQAKQGVKATGMISPRGIIYDNNVGYHLFLERYHNGDKVEVQIRKIEKNGK